MVMYFMHLYHFPLCYRPVFLSFCQLSFIVALSFYIAFLSTRAQSLCSKSVSVGQNGRGEKFSESPLGGVN